MLSLNNLGLFPSVSIVICFRDWGLDRLAAAVEFHLSIAKERNINIEVVVSDYGSKNYDEVFELISTLGAKVVHTETTEAWNRSAALNAGVEAASNDYIITTDADIIFSPSAVKEAIDLITLNPNALYLVQCRDLPESYNCEALLNMYRNLGKIDFELLDAASQIRARWGMGGFAAFSKSAFFDINGYEERMKIWGKEDNDFGLRFRRSRMPVRWITGSKVRIFHIWHESSQSKANETDEGKAALLENQRILDKDLSIVRNLNRRWISHTKPLISIVMPTYKRNLQLYDALRSCIAQTFENFEVLVIENGESEGADKVVRAIGDKRIRYLKTEKKGAAAARNIGTKEALGRYIVIHDDDDIMISTRLSDHLRALEAGSHGSYGGWIDFEDDNGEVISTNPGKEFTFNSLLCSGKVLIHPGTMLDARILKMFPYNEDLPAGIDYGLFLNIARNGLRLNHTGKYAILRRMHSTNMTRTNSQVQKESASYMKEIILSEIQDNDFKSFREKGISAVTFNCDNEKAALAELSDYCKAVTTELEITSKSNEVYIIDPKTIFSKSDISIDDILLNLIKKNKVLIVNNSKKWYMSSFIASRLRYLSSLNRINVEIHCG